MVISREVILHVCCPIVSSLRLGTLSTVYVCVCMWAGEVCVCVFGRVRCVCVWAGEVCVYVLKHKDLLTKSVTVHVTVCKQEVCVYAQWEGDG